MQRHLGPDTLKASTPGCRTSVLNVANRIVLDENPEEFKRSSMNKGGVGRLVGLVKQKDRAPQGEGRAYPELEDSSTRIRLGLPSLGSG